MTNVRFSITRETLTGREQVGGVIEARPSARRNLATEVVLPDAVRIVLTAGEDAPVVDLEPTTSQWVWRIIERVEKGAHGSRFLAVPDTEDMVEYVELVEVDPASLDPLPSVPTVADALEAEALAREAADAALADEVAAKADAAALADKADLVAGAVPDEQLPERLSDTSLNATIASATEPLAVATRIATPTWTILSDEQARATRPWLVAIGDSITDNNRTTTTWTGSTASRTAAYRADGCLTRAMIALRQRGSWWDVGVSGETAAQGLAKFDNEVTPLEPQVVLEGHGSNDIAAGRSAEDTFADKYGMWVKAWALGAYVVATTAPPRNTYTDTQEQEAHRLNGMLRNFAEANPARFTLVDWWASFVDPLTGNWDAALVDAAGVHPNTLGALVAGEDAMADALRPLLPTSFDPLPTSNVNDLDNLMDLPLMTGATGGVTANKGLTGQGATGWTASSTGTDANLSAALSKVARNDGFGDWQQIDISMVPSTSAYVVFNRTARAGSWAVGDVVQAVCDIETDAPDWTDGPLDLQLLAVDGGTIYHLASALSRGGDAVIQGRMAAGILRTPPIVIPAGVTALRVSLMAGGTGTVRFGRVAIRKLPTA